MDWLWDRSFKRRALAHALEQATLASVIRNIIFDWSGTLVDDLPAVLDASNHVFRLAGVPEMTTEQFRAQFSLPFKDFYDRYAGHVPLPRLEEWFHARFHEVQDLVVELPHAREFLKFCRKHGVRTFLLSSVHPTHFAAQLARTGFGEFLDHPYVGVWDKRARIHDLLRDHALEPDETMFIGDMAHDIETGRHGGVFSCAVLTGYNDVAQLRAFEPHLIVENLGELRDILDASGFRMESAPAPNGSAVHGPLAPRFPIPTVGALIFNPEGEALMVRTRKWSNLWGIPGGKIRTGETAVNALERELKEETNLSVTDIQFVVVQDCINSHEFYRKAHFLLLNYTCNTGPNPQVQLNSEAQEFQWLALEDALGLPLNTPTRVLIEAVRAGSPAA